MFLETPIWLCVGVPYRLVRVLVIMEILSFRARVVIDTLGAVDDLNPASSVYIILP